MASYTDDDLISLADESASPLSSATIAPITNRMAVDRHKPAQRDSFSDLTGLMKAKKPYTPTVFTSPPSTVPSISTATNGVPFASRLGSGSSILSPLARPFHAGGSVAAYLQDQARSPITTVTAPASEYREKDMHRLETMLRELEDLPIDDDVQGTETAKHEQTATTIEPLPPGFELPTVTPMHTAPMTPPTPAMSTKPVSAEEPVVRVTMHVWNAMARDLEVLKEEKRTLETKLARFEKQATPQDDDYTDDLKMHIGKLQYQNEANKVQKATMARTLSEKDMQIKSLQLDLERARTSLGTASTAARGYADILAERDYLQASLKSNSIAKNHLADMTDVKDQEIQLLSKKVDDLQRAPEQPTIVHTDVGEYKALAQKRLDQVNQREKLLRLTQEKYATEHTKVAELEDHVEDLRRKLDQVGDLQTKLQEKSSECDRFRTRLKNQEKTVEDYKQRTLRASDDGKALRGAAHLVLPQPNAKLSPLVLGCSECYAKNITCDNKARCRHCTENNEKCSRWRCSLKHILAQCPDVPCKFPHESDGWLLQTDPRPQW